MTKAMNWFALLLLGAALIIMFMPTWVSRWEGGVSAEGLTYYRWYAAQLGFGDFAPIACFVLLMLMIILVVAAVRTGVILWVTMVLGGAISLILAIFGYDRTQASFVDGFGALVAPLVATATLVLLITKIKLTRKTRIPVHS